MNGRSRVFFKLHGPLFEHPGVSVLLQDPITEFPDKPGAKEIAKAVEKRRTRGLDSHPTVAECANFCQ